MNEEETEIKQKSRKKKPSKEPKERTIKKI